MPRTVALASLALTGLLATSAAAEPSRSIQAGGGLGPLALSVDAAAGVLRHEACKGEPCAVTATSPSVAVAGASLPIDPRRVSVEDVPLSGGRHVGHVRVLLGDDATAEAPAWEALVAAGSPPLFAGATGWVRGEPGERSGTEIRLLEEEQRTVVLIGEIREDLRLCGDDATLLDPRGLDPSTLTFHHATMQRLSATRREGATSVTATPRKGPAEPALAPLLSATDATSGEQTARALTDGDLSTAWSELRPGRGQGELVLMRAPFDVPIVRFAVTVTPTSPKPDGVAPRTFYLATSGAAFEVTVPEDAWSHPGWAYDIALPQPVQTSCVALVLADAFARGKAHPEVTVAELAAYSPFDRPGATLAEVAEAMAAGDARAAAAAALLERAGEPGMAAMAAVYPRLGPAGRALAVDVAASGDSCARTAKVLTSALADPDEVVRGKAHAKLEQPRCGREALPELLAALRDDAARPRVAATAALFGRQKAVGPLTEVLGLGSPEDRRAVRAALGMAARDSSSEDLAAALRGAAARSVDAGVDALRALQEQLGGLATVADPIITAALATRPPLSVRYPLVDLLGVLAARGDGQAQATLADLLRHDPANEVRAHAAELVALGRDPREEAMAALADPEPRVREAAVRAAGEARLGAVTDALAGVVGSDPWFFVRVAAATALASLPASEAADRALGDALDQRATRVREQATVALGARGARAYAGRIRKQLTRASEDLSVRLASAHAAGRLCDRDAVDALTAMVVTGATSQDAGEVALGLAATEALGALHPQDLAARLAPLQAKQARPDARAAAAEALAQPGRCGAP